MVSEDRDNLVNLILNDQDLGVIGKHLISKLEKPVVLSNHSGKVFYAEAPYDFSYPINNQYIDLPPRPNEPYIYDKINKQFIFFGPKDKTGESCIMILDCQDSELDQYIKACETVILPLRIFFLKYHSLISLQDQLKREFIEDLLLNNISEIEEIILKSKDWGIDYARTTYVTIYEPETRVDLNRLQRFFESYFQETNQEAICCPWIDSIVIIFPIPSHNRTTEVDWDRAMKDIRMMKKTVDEKFKIQSSVGIGQSYSTLQDIHKSFREAKTALIIPSLMGEQNVIKPFSQLGVFKLLYMGEIDVLKVFCEETLGRLFEFDTNHNGKLVETLRALFDGNMDLKKVSQEMFIHLNTLKYRITQIENLLNVNLNQMETRTNLFVALKLRDSLVANHFIDK